jgi:hypothetical protein
LVDKNLHLKNYLHHHEQLRPVPFDVDGSIQRKRHTEEMIPKLMLSELRGYVMLRISDKCNMHNGRTIHACIVSVIGSRSRQLGRISAIKTQSNN